MSLKNSRDVVRGRSNKNTGGHNKHYLNTITLLLTVFLSACASIGNYNPDPQIANGVLTVVNVKNAIKISNTQPSTEEHELEFRGIIVNYNQFTQSLVEALKMELERNAVTISETAGKELKVAVTKIEMYTTSFNFRAEIFAEVKLGSGDIEKFNVTRASYGSPLMMSQFPTRPLDVAFKDLVSEVINNGKVQKYLNE